MHKEMKERQLDHEEAELIKKIEYAILKEIKKICDRHNIRFFMIGGTLLGAVRHHGIIPWDDDIDIGLLRKDYELFIRYAQSELPPYLKTVNYHTDPNCGEPFTKIMDMRGKMVEKFTASTKAPQGVFVDVFPVDNAPDSFVRKTVHRFKNYTIRKLILLDANYNFRKTGIKKLGYDLLTLYAKCRGRDSLIKAYEKNAAKYADVPCKNVVILGSNYGYEIENIDSEAMAEVKTVPFEDGEYPIPVGYERYLRKVYGDYMQLPPVEKRTNKHKLVDLDLSAFKDIKL